MDHLRAHALTGLLAALGALDRRVAGWRRRAALALLRREHPGLELPDGVHLEPELLWRLAADAHVAVGAGTRLRRACELKADAGARLVIGRNVHVGPWCTFSALAEITIGDDCLIAERVSIRDHDHFVPGLHRGAPAGPADAARDPALPYHAQGYATAPVVIGRNVWIGGGVTIVKGVRLGDGCVVGANAVVTRSYPAGSVIAGVPARPLRPAAA